jgi:hypothetical protein
MDSDLQGIDELPDHWVMYFDGSYTLKGAEAGAMLIPSYTLTNYLVLVLIPFDPMQQYVPYNEGAVLLACGAVVYLFI